MPMQEHPRLTPPDGADQNLERLEADDAVRETPATPLPVSPDGNKAAVAGCRLRSTGPVRFFRTGGFPLAPGDLVRVETEVGVMLVTVATVGPVSPALLRESEYAPRGVVVGPAGPTDAAKAEENEKLAAQAYVYCRERIVSHGLDMNLVEVEIALDRGKMAFYFTAPTRIDFRELVKDLVRAYRARIDLRQIGVRHETQCVGGVGNCGMVCCCRRYMRKFAPVTIKMAKEQNVFLNPAKISGICGRLLCCLAFEQENYDAFYRDCPKLGKKYQTERGPMRVLRASLFRESVSVLSDDGEELEFPLEEWRALVPWRPGVSPQPAAPRPQGDEETPQAQPGHKAPAERLPRDRPAPERAPRPPAPPRREGEAGQREHPGKGGRAQAPTPQAAPEAASAAPDADREKNGRAEKHGSIFGLPPRRPGK